jgi:hypothetical protein
MSVRCWRWKQCEEVAKHDSWVAEASKLGEMYADFAREAYKPVEKAVTKKLS